MKTIKILIMSALIMGSWQFVSAQKAAQPTMSAKDQISTSGSNGSTVEFVNCKENNTKFWNSLMQKDWSTSKQLEVALMQTRKEIGALRDACYSKKCKRANSQLMDAIKKSKWATRQDVSNNVRKEIRNYIKMYPNCFDKTAMDCCPAPLDE